MRIKGRFDQILRMDGPREAQLAVASPQSESAPVGFPPTLQKVPPTQHTAPRTTTTRRLGEGSDDTHTARTHTQHARGLCWPIENGPQS